MASCAEAAAYMLRTIGNRPKNPDPGNRRLPALAADPIFAAFPGADRTSWQENPAK